LRDGVGTDVEFLVMGERVRRPSLPVSEGHIECRITSCSVPTGFREAGEPSLRGDRPFFRLRRGTDCLSRRGADYSSSRACEARRENLFCLGRSRVVSADSHRLTRFARVTLRWLSLRSFARCAREPAATGSYRSIPLFAGCRLKAINT
jgi:hypothetical protein